MTGDRNAGQLQEPREGNHQQAESSVGAIFLAELHDGMTQSFFKSPSIFKDSQEANREEPRVAKAPESHLPDFELFDPSLTRKAA